MRETQTHFEQPSKLIKGPVELCIFGALVILYHFRCKVGLLRDSPVQGIVHVQLVSVVVVKRVVAEDLTPIISIGVGVGVVNRRLLRLIHIGLKNSEKRSCW